VFDLPLHCYILTLKHKNDQIIDNITQDEILEANFFEAARERANNL
jgi:hypothetical protein